MQPERISLPDAPGTPFYQTLVETCVRGVLESLGESELDALILIGAPTRGEPTVVETAAGPYSLSDVDMACIVRHGADIPLLKSKLASWVASANEELKPVCSGVDVSMRRRGDARGFHPLIATYEMLRTPSVVWGDPSVLGELPDFRVEDVPAWDCLRLLHNRIVEQVVLHRRLARRPADERSTLSDLYATGKLTLDAMTAFLFLEREVPERYVDRAAVFRRRITNLPWDDRLRVALEAHLPRIDALARFKASGDRSLLATAFGTGTDTAGLIEMTRECFRANAEIAEAMWRLLVERASGGEARGEEIDAVAALYSRLETLPRKAVRAMRMLRSPAGRAGLFSAGRVVALSPFASPKELAYLSAVVIYLELSARIDGDEARAALRRWCPFNLPRDFWSLDEARRREALLDRLDLFRHAVLHGRKVSADR